MGFFLLLFSELLFSLFLYFSGDLGGVGWGSRVASDELSRGVTTVAFFVVFCCCCFCLVGLSCCSGLTRGRFIAAPPSLSLEVPSVVGVMEVIFIAGVIYYARPSSPDCAGMCRCVRG